MKKLVLPPLYIVLASALYFFIASVLLSLEPGTESKPDNKRTKYYTSGEIGSTTLMSAVAHVPPVSGEKNYNGIISKR